ncbi:unnamed protein product [Prorocentrum cordatum]|uniref:Uncharacterized protein n=1 Tax=Prorocentrum cordatum TaxID=2364126 RepID=A0ABN9U3Q0_9DINO|nr:unnamed protein product [Polarella glacialis]
MMQAKRALESERSKRRLVQESAVPVAKAAKAVFLSSLDLHAVRACSGTRRVSARKCEFMRTHTCMDRGAVSCGRARTHTFCHLESGRQAQRVRAITPSAASGVDRT